MPKSKLSPPKWAKFAATVFFFTVVCLLYFRLGRDPLFDWDEGIYAELGKELLHSGKFFVNSWNYLPWFEKPPGISWLTALSQSILGSTAFGARFFMPLVSVLTLYSLYQLGTALENWRVGLMAAGFLAGFNLFLGRARALNTDMPLLLGIITTCYFILTRKKSWQVALIIALSVWFKGLAGLLSLAVALPLFFSRRRPSLRYFVHTVYFLFLFILPWHLFAYFVYGSKFLTPYFWEQVFRRATVPVEFHLESRWFYFQYLYQNLGLGMLIGLGLGIGLLSWQLVKSRDSKRAFLLWWFFFPLGLFTLAKTRLFWYILPLYPALALILAHLLESFVRDYRTRKVLAVVTLGVLSQATINIAHSVELSRSVSPLPDRLKVAAAFAGANSPLVVLVPPTERVAEAVLPASQRLSSSFRYGGMPSVVFYYQGPVRFFYNVDDFNKCWRLKSTTRALINRQDRELVSTGSVAVSTPTYLGLTQEDNVSHR